MKQVDKTYYSETSVDSLRTAMCYSPEDRMFYNRSRDTISHSYSSFSTADFEGCSKINEKVSNFHHFHTLLNPERSSERGNNTIL
jgi:hypothetical protein